MYNPITMKPVFDSLYPLISIYANDVKYACDSAITKGNPKIKHNFKL